MSPHAKMVLKGDFDNAKNAVLRTKAKNRSFLFIIFYVLFLYGSFRVRNRHARATAARFQWRSFCSSLRENGEFIRLENK